MGLTHKEKMRGGKIKKRIIIAILAVIVLVAAMVILLCRNKVKDIVTVEAGTKTLDVSDFIKNRKNEGTFVTNLDSDSLNTPGIYDVGIKIGKKVYPSNVEVIDTIAPTGETVDLETWVNEKVEAGEFVQNVTDITDVDIYFAEAPDFSKSGRQEISIVLEDTSGNSTQLKALLNIKRDTEPPEIIGVEDQTVYVDEAISYRRDVIVMDNKDENIDLEIDSSGVNIKKAGSYEVIYSATDSAGNTATEIAIINVREKPIGHVTEEELNILVDEVLAGILEEDMTEMEELWAIYRWIRTHITYSGYSDKANWTKEAARGIQRGTGDCFTYYATSKALLTRAGFESMMILRDTDSSFHAWSLVKFEDNWYHFDPTPSRRGKYYVCFLRTDEEVLEHSEWCEDYFKFDPAEYPATPSEPVEHPRIL